MFHGPQTSHCFSQGVTTVYRKELVECKVSTPDKAGERLRRLRGAWMLKPLNESVHNRVGGDTNWTQQVN